MGGKMMLAHNHAIMIGSLMLALSLSSCKEEVEVLDWSSEELLEYTISASSGIATKTVNDQLNTVWAENDELAVLYYSDSKMERSRFAHMDGSIFTGLVFPPDDGSDWYAVYPYDAVGNDGTVTVTMPEVQGQQGNGSMSHLAGESFPLFGAEENVSSGDNLEMQMDQVATVIRVRVTNTISNPITVSSINLTSSTPSVGSFVASAGTSLVWNAVEDESGCAVTLNVSNAEQLAPGATADYYVGLMPFTGTLEVSVSSLCGSLTAVSAGETVASAEYGSGEIHTIAHDFAVSNIDGLVESMYELVTCPVTGDDASGKYIIVNTADDKAFVVSGTGNATVSGTPVYSVDNKLFVPVGVDPDAYSYNMEYKGALSTVSVPSSKGVPSFDMTRTAGDNTKYIYYSSSKIQYSDSNKNGDRYYRISLAWNGDEGYYNLISTQTPASENYSHYFLTYDGSKFVFENIASPQIPENSHGVHLYKYCDGHHFQHLSFERSEVTWMMDDEEQDETLTACHYYDTEYPVQTLFGAQTDVVYGSSDSRVVEVSGDKLVAKASGTVTITATAQESDSWYSASASYTLTISNSSAFNLESTTLHSYLDAIAGEEKYHNDAQWKSKSIVSSFTCGKSGEGYDWPSPVVISELGDAASITIYNDKEKTDVELTGNVSSGTATIYNLIPNRKYYFTTSNGLTGKFYTEGRRRQIKVASKIYSDRTANLAHANNLRDFGGLETVDGKHIKYGKIFRGTNMDQTTDEEKAIITGYLGVRLDVDLRRSLSDGGSNDMGGSGHSTNIFYPNDVVGFSNAGFTEGSDMYNINRIGPTLTDILTAVVQGKPVYIHCTAGADRTGYVCMMLQGLLGVSLSDCTIDYELTSFSCVGSRPRTGIPDYWTSKAVDTSHIDQFHQNVENEFKRVGVSDDLIAGFRSAMLE